MTVTYIGSRQHIAELVGDFGGAKSVAVVDAVTLNREELREQLGAAASSDARLLIRPERVAESISAWAADYISWQDDIESTLSEFGGAQVLNLPRSAEDWDDDIDQTIEYRAFCLVEPAKQISLISRRQRNELVQAALQSTSSGSPVRSSGVPSTVPAKSVIEALKSELGQDTASEGVKPVDLYDVMVASGMAPDLSERVIAAQQLVVSKEPGDESNCAEAIEDLRTYVNAKKEMRQ